LARAASNSFLSWEIYPNNAVGAFSQVMVSIASISSPRIWSVMRGACWCCQGAKSMATEFEELWEGSALKLVA